MYYIFKEQNLNIAKLTMHLVAKGVGLRRASLPDCVEQ